MGKWVGVVLGMAVAWAGIGWADEGVHLVYTADLRSTLGLCG